MPVIWTNFESLVSPNNKICSRNIYFCQSEWNFVSQILRSDTFRHHWIKTRWVVPFQDPSMKNQTASMLKSTQVHNTSFKRIYPCSWRINYRSSYWGKHINSPLVFIWKRIARFKAYNPLKDHRPFYKNKIISKYHVFSHSDLKRIHLSRITFARHWSES